MFLNISGEGVDLFSWKTEMLPIPLGLEVQFDTTCLAFKYSILQLKKQDRTNSGHTRVCNIQSYVQQHDKPQNMCTTRS